MTPPELQAAEPATPDHQPDQAPSPAGPASAQIELSAGIVEYIDTGGAGPVLVMLHGLMLDAGLWEAVISELAGDHRCIAPTLPLGAHRHGMHDGADLSLSGIASLVEELLDKLDLREATLVGNDTGGSIVQLLMGRGSARIAGAVLVACDAFDNFPPGLTGKALVQSGKLPPALFGLFMQQMRLRPLRRLPIAFGWLTRRGDAVVVRSLRPVLEQPEIRRDTVQVLRAIGAQRDLMLEAAEALPGFDRPALVVWAGEDRVMPPEHGQRLADLLPQGRLVEILDSDTLIPLDQPRQLAEAIREFSLATT
ncbi:MAG TPA: alpha/beta hydrolase [Solirubrobacteraceae bacterium]